MIRTLIIRSRRHRLAMKVDMPSAPALRSYIRQLRLGGYKVGPKRGGFSRSPAR